MADTAREEGLPINEPITVGRYDLEPRSVIVVIGRKKTGA
jgi:hypothetical protein